MKGSLIVGGLYIFEGNKWEPGIMESLPSSLCFPSPSHVFSLTMVSKVMSDYRLKPQAKSSLFSYKFLSGVFCHNNRKGTKRNG